MRWMNHLYTGDRASLREKELKAGIRDRKWSADTYVLMPASNPRDQVDILHANFLRQPHYRNQRELTIIGIASGKQDALNLLMRITDECVRLTGGADLRSYLEKRIGEEGTAEIL